MRNFRLAVLTLLCTVRLFAGAPYLVKDINQTESPTGSNPRAFLQIGGSVVFNTTDSSGNPLELWRTDGTDAGTFRLAAGGFNKVLWNGKIWFLTAAAGELWSTDGTVAGTQKMAMPSGMPSPATASWLMGGPSHLYFFNGDKLWQSDGTTGSTIQASSVSFTPAWNFTWITFNQSLFFLASGNGGAYNSLWRADAGGVTLVRETPETGSFFARFLGVVGNTIYLDADSNLHGGLWLWRTDGTSAGTVSVKSLQTPGTILAIGSTAYFTAADDTGSKFWRSDGTDAGTVVLASSIPGVSSTYNAFPLGVMPNGTILLRGPSVPPYPAANSSWGLFRFDGSTTTFLTDIPGTQSGFAILGNGAVFNSDTTVWRTDGTAAGTTPFPAPATPLTSTGAMTAIGSTVYFDAADAVHGDELWKTDGYTVTFVSDIIVTTYPSSPVLLRAFKGGLLFIASSDTTDPYHPVQDLWFSDGTDAGTQKLFPNASAGDIRPCGGVAFFDHWSPTADDLWTTDGTAAGTAMLKSFSLVHGMTCIDNHLLFAAKSSANGNTELWRSDGSASGTLFVASIPPPNLPFNRLGHNIVFVTNDNVVWRSDGTAAGTFAIKTLDGSFSSGVRQIQPFVVAGPYVYFGTFRYDGQESLWRSDGTAAGTFPVVTDEFVYLVGGFNGRAVFNWESNNIAHGGCTTDGTSAGIVCFDGWLGANATEFSMRSLNGRLYYENGSDLRSTDGVTYTDTGVTNVMLLFDSAGGRLYFSNWDYRGTLYETDGTVAGTTRLIGNVDTVAASGGRLFISAGELYAYDLAVTPTSFAPQSVDSAGGQSVTVSGRGFTGPAAVTVGGIAATVGSITDSSIVFTAPPHDPGTYDVELSLGDGRRMFLDAPLAYTCTAPTAVASAATAPVCPMTPVQLQGSGATRCAWFPATGLDDPSSCTPKASVATTTTYTLIVSSASGCASTNNPTVTVTVMPAPNATITIPYPLLTNATYTASVPDGGAGATYAWSGSGITIDDPTLRTITFHTTCANGQLTSSVTAANGCVGTSTVPVAISSPGTITGFSPHTASPGTLVTITGSGFQCATRVTLASDGHVWFVTPSSVTDSTIQFRFPADGPNSSIIIVLSAYTRDFLYRTARHDFDLNHMADVFWRNSATGETSFWFMRGASYSGVRSLTVPTDWTPAAIGDFDGNGIADIFWRNGTTGETSIWLMSGGATPATAVRSLTIPTDWVPAGTGDFDGDGRSDIFWHNAKTGETSIWFMNGVNFTGLRSWTVPTGWVPVAFGDFDDDGKTDIFWMNTTTGETSIWLMNGTFPAVAVRSVTVDPTWSVAGAGDFDGDHKDDLFWFNPSTGQTGIWFMNGATVDSWASSVTVSDGWRPVSVGIFDGDRWADIFWHNDKTGETGLWHMYQSTIGYWNSLTTVSDTNWKPVSLP